jgi:hypothetical protein
MENRNLDFKNLTEKDAELLDYQDCRPGTPGRDPLDSKSLPDHVRKAIEEARSKRRSTDSGER